MFSSFLWFKLLLSLKRCALIYIGYSLCCCKTSLQIFTRIKGVPRCARSRSFATLSLSAAYLFKSVSVELSVILFTWFVVVVVVAVAAAAAAVAVAVAVAVVVVVVSQSLLCSLQSVFGDVFVYISQCRFVYNQFSNVRLNQSLVSRL